MPAPPVVAPVSVSAAPVDSVVGAVPVLLSDAPVSAVADVPTDVEAPVDSELDALVLDALVLDALVLDALVLVVVAPPVSVSSSPPQLASASTTLHSDRCRPSRESVMAQLRAR